MKQIILTFVCAATMLAVCGTNFGATMSKDPNDIWKNVPKTTPSDLWPALPPKLDLSAYRNTCGKDKGSASASVQTESKEGPRNAFEGSDRPFTAPGKSAWLQYRYNNNTAQEVIAYVVAAAFEDAKCDPKSWRLLGSNDGKKWEPLDEQTKQAFPNREQQLLFKVAKSAPYTQYRLEVTENNGGDCTRISEVRLLADKNSAAPPEEPAKKQHGKKQKQK
jgi:hypothetical protein